ncbi:MAG: hypothetical protein PF489_16095 [Salinivirgaceae bacterium]|jgi:hypothetical protein|nr:hypothetical protein [Salinivirgaceae bacterium]
MKSLLKNLGIIVILIGAVILAITMLSGSVSNVPLAIGGGVIVIGLIAQVVIGRYVD